jgi:hypothetical protein
MTLIPVPIQTLLVISGVLVLLYILRMKRTIHNDALHIFLLDLKYQLSDLPEYEDVSGDFTSLCFQSRALMDQVLNDIHISMKECGYAYLHEKFELNLSTFALQRDKDKIFFEIHCHPQDSESESIYEYFVTAT